MEISEGHSRRVRLETQLAAGCDGEEVNLGTWASFGSTLDEAYANMVRRIREFLA